MNLGQRMLVHHASATTLGSSLPPKHSPITKKHEGSVSYAGQCTLAFRTLSRTCAASPRPSIACKSRSICGASFIKFPSSRPVRRDRNVSFALQGGCSLGAPKGWEKLGHRERTIAVRAKLDDSGYREDPRGIDSAGNGPNGSNQYNGVFLLLLLNVLVFVADHVLKLPVFAWLYLHHSHARWYQFVTSLFCHADWNHLSGNLFFVYIFGKLVEEDEGPLGLWVSYLITGAGANLVSWLLLPASSVSVGASGAVFGLFAISVLIKLRWSWRKLLEVLILGQFVVEKIVTEARTSAALGMSGNAMASGVNHTAHLAGALLGVALIWTISHLPENP